MAGRFSVEAVFKAVDRITAPVSKMQSRIGKFTRSSERNFRKLNNSINKTAAGLVNAGKTTAKFAAIGIGAITTSVGLLIREFSKIEDAEAAFTPLLGGANKAKELVEALNNTAASTPFQFETLAGSANQLLPVMNGNIEKTIKTLRMLGDTSGGNAQKLDSITRGFTKAMLKGKVDMESLNMIAEAGVPIFDDLAAVMGTKVNASFFKMISAGKVTTEQLTKAFEKMTSNGGKFFNGMDIASRTTSGMFSTLKDNISLTAAEIGGVLAPTIKDLLSTSIEYAKSIREWVKDEDNRRLMIEKVTEAVNAVKSAFIGFKNGVAWMKEHGETIIKVTAAVVGFSLAAKGLAAAFAIVNIVMTMNPLARITLAIIAAVAAVVSLIKWLDRAIDKLGGFAQIGRNIAGVFGFGDDADVNINHKTDRRGRSLSKMVTPQERVARSIEESRSTSTAEVTIKDDTNRAELTAGKFGGGLQLQQTGAY